MSKVIFLRCEGGAVSEILTNIPGVRVIVEDQDQDTEAGRMPHFVTAEQAAGFCFVAERAAAQREREPGQVLLGDCLRDVEGDGHAAAGRYESAREACFPGGEDA